MTEEDAVFSKKCKLFYKKEGNFVEKGVGMLYLKSADKGKTQVGNYFTPVPRHPHRHLNYFNLIN